MHSSEQYNIFEKLSNQDYKRMRELMIKCVLTTDMAKHFSELAKFKSRIAAEDFNPKEGDKDFAISMAMHLADISNPTKLWSTCRKWTDLLFEEFFIQGDAERKAGMKISYLMDREVTNLAKA